MATVSDNQPDRASAPARATAAQRHRERQIAEVLVRRGMPYLVTALGLERVAALERSMFGRGGEGDSPAPPRQLRLALEELGTTFIKLGQLVSTRSDVLPVEYSSELATLQDRVPAIPGEVVRELVDSELHGQETAAFASFSLEPLASASIGQAHLATLRDGTEVVVKVRRPGAVEQVHLDLEVLRNLAVRASRRWEAAARFDLVGLADEFARTIAAELDYLNEARNAERFAANFADVPNVEVPRVFTELTTSRVITLERVRGVKVSDLTALDAAGIDRNAAAEQVTRAIAKMVFDDGFFHADPHPGNLFVAPDGGIAIIDFGMVGRIDEPLRTQLRVLLIALIREDPEGMTRALIALGAASGPIDRGQLRDDVAQLLADRGLQLGEISLADALREILDIVRRHRLRVPRDLVMLLRTIIMIEGVTTQLDPGFDPGAVLTPFIRRQALAQFTPAALARRMEQAGLQLAELTMELPGELHRALDVLASGGLDVRLSAAEFEPLVARGERLGRRIAASVIAAAVIDALAELASHDRVKIARKPGRVLRVSAVAGLGAVAAWRRTPAAALLAKLRSQMNQLASADRT